MTDRNLLELLIKHEGLRQKVYDDATGDEIHAGSRVIGNPTIGIGRNLRGNGISEAEAIVLCSNDVESCRCDLMDLIPDFWNLSKTRRHALINMRFNLGPQRFREFEKFLLALEGKRYDIAGDEMLRSRWEQQVGIRAHELADMIRKG